MDRNFPQTAHADNEWVEVQRSSTTCLWQYLSRNDSTYASKYFEGLSYGFPLWAYPAEFKARTLQPYGCWFYMLRGTGIYVNVGKTLVQYSRAEATNFLNITVNYGTADYYFCRKLRSVGYDSLQIFNSHKPFLHELVICSDECTTKKITSSCVPIELRTGWNATKSCICNETYPILNCNKEITDKVDCDLEYRLNPDMIPTMKDPNLKQTCFYEDFEWGYNKFRSFSLVNVFFSNNRHSGTSHLAELTSCMRSFKDKPSSILVDLGHYSKVNFEGNVSHLLEEMSLADYDIVTMGRLDSTDLNPKKYKFRMLSLISPGFLRSTVIDRSSIKFGFISVSHHTHLDVDLVLQVILDEVLCLKRWSDIVILLGDSSPDMYMNQVLNKYVDVIISNTHTTSSKSCNGMYYTKNDSCIVHFSHNSSNIGLISFNILNKEQYTIKSDILDKC